MLESTTTASGKMTKSNCSDSLVEEAMMNILSYIFISTCSMMLRDGPVENASAVYLLSGSFSNNSGMTSKRSPTSP